MHALDIDTLVVFAIGAIYHHCQTLPDAHKRHGLCYPLAVLAAAMAKRNRSSWRAVCQPTIAIVRI